MLDEPISFDPLQSADRTSVGANRLLAALPREARDRLAPSMRLASHLPGSILFEAGDRPDLLHFPAEGTVLSLLLPLPGSKAVETVMVGAEGAAGALHGADTVPSAVRCVVLAGGRVLQVPAAAVAAAMAATPEGAAIMARYAALLLAQVHQAVACAALHPVEARVSRWLLSARMRLGAGVPVPTTQEILADRLGVRRTTVTRVIAALETKGLILHRRGRIHVEDPEALAGACCACHAAMMRQFAAVSEGLLPARPDPAPPVVSGAWALDGHAAPIGAVGGPLPAAGISSNKA